MGILNPWLILGILAALVVAFFTGMRQHAIMDDAALVGALTQAAEQGKVASAKSAKRESEFLARQRAKEKENAALRKKLNVALASVPDCPVPGPVVGLLNDAAGVPADTGAPGKPHAAAAPPAAVECRAVIESAAGNYAEVCRPNADQLEALQGWVLEFCKR